jgi:hypothetical protein
MTRFLTILALVTLLTPPAQVASQEPSLPAVPSPGQISGHIYRADSGEPLSNAFVVVQSAVDLGVKLGRTAADGSYAVAGVAPGNYWIVVYRAGFIPEGYGDNTPAPCPNCVTVGSGQKVVGMDLRLVANPSITTMSDDGLNVASSVSACRNCPVRFSPDGAFLALGTTNASPSQTRLWLYDMRSKQLVPVMLDLQGLPSTRMPLELAWADGDTLYIKHGEEHPYLRLFKLSGVKMAGTNGNPPSFSAQEVSDVPVNVARELNRKAEVQNDRYIVNLEVKGPGNNSRLVVRLADGSREQDIADDVGDFLFDKNRSLVFYLKFADGYPYHVRTIVTVDLNTRGVRETPLPIWPEGLVDQTQNGSGSLVVYKAQGPCEPDELDIEAEIERIRTRYSTSADRSPHICFVSLP